MKISKYVLPVVCLCTLSSCGSSVTRDEFIKYIRETEGHKYEKATVELVREIDGLKDEGKCVFTLQNDKYVSDSDNPISYSIRYYVGMTVNEVSFSENDFNIYEEDAKAKDSNAKISSGIKYYIKPYKVVGSFSASFSSDKTSGQTNVEYTYKFDKYGNLTFMETNMTYKSKVVEDGYKSTTSEKNYYKLSITYKDR